MTPHITWTGKGPRYHEIKELGDGWILAIFCPELASKYPEDVVWCSDDCENSAWWYDNPADDTFASTFTVHGDYVAEMRCLWEDEIRMLLRKKDA
jgi:hypothetical protein